jgi:hypothetical protein
MKPEELDRLLRVIQNETGVGQIELSSKSRLREVVQARYLFYHFAANYLSWTEKMITSYLGKNRTLIHHFKKMHMDLAGYDKDYSHLYYRIRKIMDIDQLVEEPKIRLTLAEEVRRKLLNRRMLIGMEC